MLETGPVRRISQPSQRWLAIAIGVIAVAGLLTGLVMHSMMVDQEGDSTMQCGLRVCDSIYGKETVSTSVLDLVDEIQRGGGKASAAWGYSGQVAWWGGMIAILGVIAALIMVATKRYIRIPFIAPTTIALVGGGLALIGGCIYVASKPGNIGVTKIGWTFWTFCGGAVLTVVSGFMLSRQLALLEPEFDPGESPEMPPDEPWQDP